MGGGARGGRGDEAPPTNSAVECDAVGVAARRQSGRVSLREAAWWGRGGVSGVWVSFERSVPGDATLVARFSFTLPVFHRSRFPAACVYTTRCRFRSIRRFRSPVSPRFVVHEILADRLVIDAVTAHALFFRAGNRAERIGWREMDSRIPPEGVRFGR